MASEDEYGFGKAIAEADKEDSEKSKNCEAWVKEANHRFSGRWIRNTAHGNFYQVIEVTKCRYPWGGGHFKYTPPETKQHMLYTVRVAAEIDPNLDSVNQHETFAEVGISIMDGKWVVATKREVAKAAMELSDKINAKIAKELDTVSTLMTIYRLSKGLP
jgi:hypothetical protein